MKLITLQQGGETAWSGSETHCGAFSDQHGAIQAGRQARAGAHRQQGALHPVHMSGDGLRETNILFVPASPCKGNTKTAQPATMSAVTSDNRTNIPQISVNLKVIPFSRELNPPFLLRPPHTMASDAWMASQAETGVSIFSPRQAHHSPLAHHNKNTIHTTPRNKLK